MSTSKKSPDLFLGKKLRPARAEALLTDWANLPDWPATVSWLAITQTMQGEPLSAGLSPLTPTEETQARRVWDGMVRLMKRYPESFPVEFHGLPHAYISEVARYLRRAWQAEDLRRREWQIFRVREEYKQIFETSLKRETRDSMEHFQQQRDEPPPLTPFEQAVYHFQGIADRARVCVNPECQQPYFFARKGQKYCDEKCAQEALREQKRNHWRKKYGKNRKGE
ncbi:MAG: hypothetical protein ROO76_22510 [Terriglobia bacterium]|nr:hypothetical protein [Terriglobia bacterium]